MPETTKIQSVAILGRGALGVMYGDFLTPRMPEGSVYFLADAKVPHSQRPPLLPPF